MQAIVDVAESWIDRGITGIAVALVNDFELTYLGEFGTSDRRTGSSVNADTTFSAQSVTKPFVATALMQFVRHGRLDLDDPVNQHLGEIQINNPWEDSTPVTIRHLLTHTGGLPEWMGWHSASLTEEVANARVVVEPGSRLTYANIGYDALGCVLAQLAEMPWDRAVGGLVLDPLGMTSSAVGGPPAGHEDQAAGHISNPVDGAVQVVKPPPWPFDPPPPSGSLISTAHDLALFLLAHFRGESLLPGALLSEMHRVHARLGPHGGMGLGFRVEQRRGQPVICHGGDGVGFTTFIGGCPQRGGGIVLLINHGGAQEARSQIARAGLDAVLEIRHSLPPRPGGVSVEDSSAPLPYGSYRSTYWNIRAELMQAPDGPWWDAVSGGVLSEATRTHLKPLGGRWLGEGGMFDGWEIDVETGDDGTARLYGGVYPLEFVADPLPVVRLPTIVEEGDLRGDWSGTADTPYGAMSIELSSEHEETRMRIPSLSADDLWVRDASMNGGWLTGSFFVEVPGIGQITVFLRLGHTGGKLEGMLYASGDLGVFAIPTVLRKRP